MRIRPAHAHTQEQAQNQSQSNTRIHRLFNLNSLVSLKKRKGLSIEERCLFIVFFSTNNSNNPPPLRRHRFVCYCTCQVTLFCSPNPIIAPSTCPKVVFSFLLISSRFLMRYVVDAFNICGGRYEHFLSSPDIYFLQPKSTIYLPHTYLQKE
ncbi:hypothetical protein CPC08DRAFT_315735 [Agrocybe pediades]|nr:hypothetical protein CPC08DRAFT_315735 [Agrocybe pediades]